MNMFGKRSDLPISRNSDREKEKSVLSFTHEQNVIQLPSGPISTQSSSAHEEEKDQEAHSKAVSTGVENAPGQTRANICSPSVVVLVMIPL